MKIISSLLSDSVVSAFGWTLVHSVWQGTLLMIVAAVVFYFSKRFSAHARYITGVSFLLAQLIASGITFGYYNLKSSPTLLTENLLKNDVSLNSAAALKSIAHDLPVTFKFQLWLSAHLHELVICWLIGAGILLLRFAGGWIFTERLRSQANIIMDKEWRARFGIITAKMNISQIIEFKESARILTPMVIGAFNPVVLIPIGLLTGFSTAQVEAILAHELAHIRRNDYLINLMQSFVEVIFFFHPAIWWLSDRIRMEREHCCDDIALRVCGDKMSLAHALVKVAEWQSSPELAMAFASKKPLLLQRIQRVLGVKPKSTGNIINLPVILLAAGMIAGLSVYAVAQKTENKEKEKAAKPVLQKQSVSMEEDVDEEEVAEVNEEPEEVEIETPEEIDIDFDLSEFSFDFDNDSLNQKMNEFHRRMQALQSEMEPFHRRMEDLNLEMEKQRFEVERFEREVQKIEWKKQRAAEARSELMEKRSAVFENNSESGKAKLNEADLEKQLADFEQQIKVHEQNIAELNSQISASRKEALKAEEPLHKLEREMQEINGKMEEISRRMELESREMEMLEMAFAPKPPRPPKPARAPQAKVKKAPRPAPAPVSPTPPSAPPVR
ncbi:M48 family metalloprotease [Dyadobacter flavalbus]|uniref:M48 family metalloprotease n=1 Tax=Dyadobacter flavalbus TaxID=2579942 RepID=A0A5M8R388_9BACT|nr:M56 family metallopeptidase [Dyadobacter flavalbus]KAA6441406.1 M48 family metalloprotease [Dyadobacter flavalbus]